ncbi:acyl-CoA thioesterase [Paracoccus versutus]
MNSVRNITSFVAHTWLCDHFGHLNARHYAAAFDDAIFVFWSGLGFRPDSDSPMPVTLEVKISFRQEIPAGSVVRIEAQVSKVGNKSVGLTFTMREAGGDELAICEVVEVFIHPKSRRSCPIPAALRAALSKESHSPPG